MQGWESVCWGGSPYFRSFNVKWFPWIPLLSAILWKYLKFNKWIFHKYQNVCALNFSKIGFSINTNNPRDVKIVPKVSTLFRNNFWFSRIYWCFNISKMSVLKYQDSTTEKFFENARRNLFVGGGGGCQQTFKTNRFRSKYGGFAKFVFHVFW